MAREKKQKIHVVKINNLPADVEFYVRASSTRAAEAFVSRNFIEARQATDDEIMEIGREGHRVFTKGEPIDLPDDSQMDLLKAGGTSSEDDEPTSRYSSEMTQPPGPGEDD